MPVISMFHGVIVLMHFFDDQQHHTAHVHARYQGQEASLSIADADVDELLADWELAVAGETLFRIDPLR